MVMPSAGVVEVSKAEMPERTKPRNLASGSGGTRGAPYDRGAAPPSKHAHSSQGRWLAGAICDDGDGASRQEVHATTAR